jgi:ATP:corrinoid adenosyltransferase
MKMSEVIEKYIAIRDRRAQRKEEFTAADLADKTMQEKIEAKLLEVFEATGQTSCKTEFGTAYKSSRSSASVADKEIFFNYIKEQQEWPLLEIRAAKAAVEKYKEDHEALPPGISWSEEVTVNIRRSA